MSSLSLSMKSSVLVNDYIEKEIEDGISSERIVIRLKQKRICLFLCLSFRWLEVSRCESILISQKRKLIPNMTIRGGAVSLHTSKNLRKISFSF